MAQKKHFYDYFQREISYLRHEGANFASNFPKVANRLDYSNVESSDPHVERLLQSFAFLTARLQKDSDELFPRISSALLDVLYPQFFSPLPSYSIAQLALGDKSGKLTGKAVVTKGTKIYSTSKEDIACFMQTTADLNLYPIKVTDVDIISTVDLPRSAGKYPTQRVLKVQLSSLAAGMDSMNLEDISFHIFGDAILQNKLYEALFLEESYTGASFGKGKSEKFIQPMADITTASGFSEDESVTPYPSHGHPGYITLQEYFAYPQKFMFFKTNARSFVSSLNNLTLYISIADEVNINSKDISSENIRIGCVPIINLFSKISEPVRVDHKKVEYRLNPDNMRDDTTEIYGIKRVFGIGDGQQQPYEFAPYFSYNHGESQNEQARFWHARRTISDDTMRNKSEVYLSFVDYDFDINQPIDTSVYAEVLCTNHATATMMNAGTKFQSDVSIPVDEISCLYRPTRQKYLSKETQSQWRLISHLALGHLSLSDDQVSINMLKELITQYGDFGEIGTIQELDLIAEFSATRVTRRIGYDAWRGFANGTKFTITLSDHVSRDVNRFLFVNVLNHFLPQFAAVNSFTELEVKQVNNEKVWKKWAPRSGRKQLA